MLVLIVALVDQSGIPDAETGPRALAIVGILSFAQAGQVSLAIGVGLAELNTTMITGAIVSYLISTDRSRTTYMLTTIVRSPPSATHAFSLGPIMHVTAAYSSSPRTWAGASLAVH
jgi:hypothetical protein